jgi:hypothetical protein
MAARRVGRCAGWLTFRVFAAAALLGWPAARAQKGYRPPPRYLQIGQPDQAEGRKILEEFRQQGIAGNYYLEFTLEVIPRHGVERRLNGRLWGARTAGGPFSRVSVRAEAGPEAPEVRLLVRSGASPALWTWRDQPGGAVQPAGAGELFAGVAGTNLTPFDLQMPFLFWTDFVYEGLVRMRGRPAHQFLLYPPAGLAAQHPELTGVRVYLDTQYTALVEADLIGEGGRDLRTLSLLDLKKVGGQWIVKAIDLRDEATRDKTRLVVTAAALNQDFTPALFDPAALAAPAAAPSGPDLVRLNP